jgi:hypothetical protein
MLSTILLAALVHAVPVDAPPPPVVTDDEVVAVLRGSTGAVVGGLLGVPAGYVVAMAAASAQVVPIREGGYPRQEVLLGIVVASVALGAYAGWCVAVPAEVTP